MSKSYLPIEEIVDRAIKYPTRFVRSSPRPEVGELEPTETIDETISRRKRHVTVSVNEALARFHALQERAASNRAEEKKPLQPRDA